MKKTFLIAAIALMGCGMQAQTLADWANKGDAAVEKGNYQEAIEYYLKAQELDTNNDDYMTALQLANAYVQVGDNEKAGEAFKQSLLKGNYDQGCITSMKKAFEAAGKPELLKQGYIDIKNALPEQAVNMDMRLYTIYTKEKDWSNALACVKTVLAQPDIDETTAIKYNKYAAQLFLNLNEADSAEVYYDKVLAVTPNDADVHKAIGLGLYTTIQKTIQNAQNTYNAKKSDKGKAQHYYAEMQTTTKRAWLNYGAKAIEHLKIANAANPDPQITDIIGKLQNNIAAYKK